MPLSFSRNGTFFAYRKLHEDIGAFQQWIETTAEALARAWGIADAQEARQTLMAKLAGRWSDGVPLMAAPTFADWTAFNRDYPQPADGSVNTERSRRLTAFGYREDPQGLKCPVGAHTRRMSTRDMLDPHASDPNPRHRAGSALNNRRRILRRGLPYGGADDPVGEQGIVMLAVCASLARQFEFVQQQWLNYGLDFGLGNDTCPLVGNHGADARFVIAADPAASVPPFIASGIPQFVSVRGGDYFFMPSMTALRMIGMGVVDPT
jgi:deferrochelatase/peroxidase EfeB